MHVMITMKFQLTSTFWWATGNLVAFSFLSVNKFSLISNTILSSSNG